MKTEEQREIRDCGKTVRVDGLNDAGLVLLVGSDITSHFWLNILPFSTNPRIRHYVTVADLETIAHRMHVLPDVVPAFLVMYGGYFVDWFPAPLPHPNAPPRPQALIKRAEEHLQDYAMTRRTQSSHT